MTCKYAVTTRLRSSERPSQLARALQAAANGGKRADGAPANPQTGHGSSRQDPRRPTGTVRAFEPTKQQPPSSAAALSPFTSPEQIKQALSSGKVTIAGKSTVNGQAAIDLRLTTKTTQLHYWVNAQTYQPVEMVVGSGHAVDITWLPKTKSLVTKVNTPRIPAGFQHVSAPAQH